MSRTEILASIRKSLNRSSLLPAEWEKISRLPQGKHNLAQEETQETIAPFLPSRLALDQEGCQALFIEKAKNASATIAKIAKMEEAPAAIAEFLRNHNFAPRLVLDSDPQLAALPFAAQALTIATTSDHHFIETALSPAFAGICETGSLLFHSSAHDQTGLKYTPENHIVLLPLSHIVKTAEEAFLRLREKYRAEQNSWMPRAVNFVTGPSRTADIEQKLILGAHGPRKLHILLVENEQ